MTLASDWRPATASERVRTIDVLRGLALFGVLIINILSDFRVPLLEHIQKPFSDSHGIDRAVDVLATAGLEFKAFTIFSFLFGVGIAIQIERGATRNVNTNYFLLMRFFWLFVLGTAHLFLVWNGDILTLYAVCGLLLLPLVSLPSAVLLLIGTVLIALPELVSFGLRLPSSPEAENLVVQARQVYAHQGYAAILRFRWHESWSLIVPLLIMVLPRTTGLMCWGMAAWRSGILRAPERHRRKLIVALLIGATVGAAITASNVDTELSGSSFWPALQKVHLDASILLALAYVSALLLWLNPWRTFRMPSLAALGQMALTNYVLQSIVLGGIFYGYGLGLFGRLGSAAAAGIGVAIFVAQLQVSRLWLRRFRFGPFEWFWRSLSYGRPQPMRVERVNHWRPGPREST